MAHQFTIQVIQRKPLDAAKLAAALIELAIDLKNQPTAAATKQKGAQ
jgi:hypothetical protein